MLQCRSDLRRLVHAAAAVVAFATSAAEICYAQPQTKLEARYTASLAGIPIGRGGWVLDIRDDKYQASASGSTAGLLRVFTSGHGRSIARGDVANGQPLPRRYGATIVTEKKTDEVEMSIEGGSVTDYTVNPPSPPNPERVPITEEHRRAIIDPLTAALIRVSGNSDPLNPEACSRSMPIFDGRMRYDLKMVFKRMEKVKAEKGYQGPVVVCSVYFSPIAGHIPGRRVIKYLTDVRDMEVWLAPIAGTRVLVPFRISVPTPLGPAVLEATQFEAAIVPRKTSANAKTP